MSRVWGPIPGLGSTNLRSGVYGLGPRASGLGFRVWGLGFRVSGLSKRCTEDRVPFTVYAIGFRVRAQRSKGSRLRVEGAIRADQTNFPSTPSIPPETIKNPLNPNAAPFQNPKT